MNGAIDVLCRPDNIPEAVILTALRARCGSHATIIVTIPRRASDQVVIARPNPLEWRERVRRNLQHVVRKETVGKSISRTRQYGLRWHCEV